MSYHRVLPKPQALFGQDPSESRASTRHTLFHHKIMTDVEPKEVLEKGKTSRSTSINTPPKGTASQRSASLESLQDYQDSPAEEAIPTRLGQKRTASLIATGDYPFRDLPSLSTAGPGIRSADSASQVCLCQPDPKVPRPRNAFILYRQHYQAAVAAQHPGLANPEISKIIGEQWRQEPAEVKNEWKILAEEEKIRHQQQYPDYRYQPRRSGRNNSTTGSLQSASATSAAGETPRCIKCGGRSMTTPNIPTPLTPTTPQTSSLSSATPSSSSSVGRFLQLVGTPKTGSGPGPTTRQRAAASQASHSHNSGGMAGILQLASLREHQRDDDSASPLSPDPKRRRFDSNGGYVPVRAGSVSLGNGQGTPFPFTPQQQQQHQQQLHHQQQQQRRRESLPQRAGSISASGHTHFPMAPPPRPSISGPITSSQRHDPSLTLPPLQTASHPTNALSKSSASASHSHTRSVEAMVMTIPYINKIKVLAKISPPLAPPPPGTSPAQAAMRGAVVAVDGQDRESVRAMVRWLEEFLGREGEYVVRVFDEEDKTNDGRADGSAEAGERDGNPFVGYLETIAAWHRRSEEIVRFITAAPNAAPAAPSTSAPTPARPWDPTHPQQQARPASPATSPKTVPGNAGTPPPPASAPPTTSCPSPPSPSSTPRSPTSTSPPTTSTTTENPPRPPPVPIALIARYQLSLSDAFASSIPINDAYAPVDHWQWMATLWRGVVGADVTVYIKDRTGGGDGHEDAGGARLGGGTGVEVRLADARAIVVRKGGAGGGGGGKGGAGLGEGALRRVGFEVGEWVRGMAGGGREDGGRG